MKHTTTAQVKLISNVILPLILHLLSIKSKTSHNIAITPLATNNPIIISLILHLQTATSSRYKTPFGHLLQYIHQTLYEYKED